MRNALPIFIAILLGILIPYGRHWSPFIRYGLMFLLFFAFLNIRLGGRSIRREHLLIALANVGLALLIFYVLNPIHNLLALAGFCVAMAPTAAAAPVIGSFLRADVGFITVSVLLTNPLVAAYLPFVLPSIVEVDQEIAVLDVLTPVFVTVGVPLLLSSLVKNFWSDAVPVLNRAKGLVIYVFSFNVWIASGVATHYILQNFHENKWLITGIALLAAVVCLLNYGVGYWIGRKENGMETSLALGRKNTMFALWVALTFIHPLVSLAPLFYILFQNILNGYQMVLLDRKG